MRRLTVGTVVVWGLACGAPWSSEADPEHLDQELEALEAQRQALHRAERQMVEDRIETGEASPEVWLLAERLGLDVPPQPPWSPAAMDGREAGVSKDHARAILDGVRREYRVDVDEALWGGAAAEALGVEAWTTPEAAIDQAIASGRDESEAVVVGVEAALHALDPWTRPVWPAQVAAWSQHHEGVSVGAGIELDQAPDGALVVTSIHEDSTAWTQGLHVGDRLLRVGDVEVSAVDAALAALAGEPGTAHELTVLRGERELRITVQSESLARRTVFGWRHHESGHGDQDGRVSGAYKMRDGSAYVRVTSFVPDSDEELGRLVGDGPVARVVLDLRGNPGGDVQASLNVADAWLDDGVVIRMDGRAAPEPEPPGPGEAAWNEAVAGGPFVGACTAVLVDGETASAAEILAGVLQQRAGAIVIGSPTAGKAVSQALRADEDLGVAWQVTNLAWALPDGTTLVLGEGVTPDVLYETTPAEAWQTARMAAERQAPKEHPDGTPVPWLGPVVGEGFPVLTGDPMVVRARKELLERCRDR